MKTQTTSQGKKTWKRELAVILLMFWSYIVLSGNVPMVEAITFPIFIYVLGAFGMDSYAKQVNSQEVNYK